MGTRSYKLARLLDTDDTNPAPLRIWIGAHEDVDTYNRSERLALNPIARAHLDRRGDRSWRQDRYGTILDQYEVAEVAQAEVAVLPRVVERTGRAELHSMIATAERHGLRTLVFGSHDLEPILSHSSAILMHAGPTRGRQPTASVLGLPYFLSDRAHEFEARPDGERPSVAFCGQGTSRTGVDALQTASRAVHLLRNRIRPCVVAPPLQGHLKLRSAALDHLHEHPGVDERFVIRDRYRAGVSTETERERTQAEFDENLRSATYALSVRGIGNFSARFYEALSFGRVPLFVDTDCVLPFEDQIDWRSRTVWADALNVSSIGDLLVRSHPEVMADPGRSAEALRSLWEEWLSRDGFFRQLVPVLRSML